MIKLSVGNAFITPTGLKLGTRGKVTAPSEFVQNLSKGDRRKIRKACHREGRGDLAHASVVKAA